MIQYPAYMRRAMRPMVNVIIMLTIAYLVVVFLVNFDYLRNRDPKRSFTIENLNSLGTDIINWYLESDPKEKDFIRHVRTMDELASHIKAKNPSVEVENHLSDWWGRPFKLNVRAEGPRTAIRITSSGANGVFEDGQGDDLYLEIVLDSDGERVETKLKSP